MPGDEGKQKRSGCGAGMRSKDEEKRRWPGMEGSNDGQAGMWGRLKSTTEGHMAGCSLLIAAPGQTICLAEMNPLSLAKQRQCDCSTPTFRRVTAACSQPARIEGRVV